MLKNKNVIMIQNDRFRKNINCILNHIRHKLKKSVFFHVEINNLRTQIELQELRKAVTKILKRKSQNINITNNKITNKIIKEDV